MSFSELACCFLSFSFFNLIFVIDFQNNVLYSFYALLKDKGCNMKVKRV